MGKFTRRARNRAVASTGRLTDEELDAQSATALPDKEAMSTISPDLGIDNFAMPINEAIAINNESVSSFAIADADQIVVLNQVDIDGAEVPVDDGGDEVDDGGDEAPGRGPGGGPRR